MAWWVARDECQQETMPMFKAGWLVVCRVLTGAALPKANSVGATSGYTLADHAITTWIVVARHGDAFRGMD